MIRLRRICAWHPGGPFVMEEGDKGAPDTHGLCPPCHDRVMAELLDRRAVQAREQRRTDEQVDAGLIPPPPPTCHACNSRPASVGLRCAICELGERLAGIDAEAEARERVEHEETCSFCRSFHGQPAPLGGLRAACKRVSGSVLDRRRE